MALIINSVVKGSVSISYISHEHSANFGYKVSGSYTVDFSDIEFEDEDSILLQGREALKEVFKRKNTVARIGGQIYKNAIISDLSFSSSTLVGSGKATFSIVENSELSSLDDNIYAQIIPNAHLLRSLSESYSFQRTGAQYSYNRQLQFQYGEGNNFGFEENVKEFSQNYVKGFRPNLGFQEDGISENARVDKNFNGTLSEKIDLINLSFSITESFDSGKINEGLGVGVTRTENESVDKEGYTSKSVNLSITSLNYNSNTTLQNAVSSLVDSLISEYSSFSSPLSISKGFTVDGKSASLSLQFSNDPRKKGGTNAFYTCAKKKTGDIITYSIEISYRAEGKTKAEKYNNSLVFWKSETDGNEAKIINLFPEASPIYEKTRSANFNRGESLVSESVSFSNEASLDTEDGILKEEISCSLSSIAEKEFRGGLVYDAKLNKQAFATNKLKKTAQASCSLSVTFAPSKDSDIDTYMEGSGKKEKMENYASSVLGGNYKLLVSSDSISINQTSRTASRSITFLAYED